MLDVKELVKQLPKSWDEVTLGMFQKLTSIGISESDDALDGVENSLKIISMLCNVPLEELEELPLRQLQLLGSQISFITELPKQGKASIKEWKTGDEISYNAFLEYLKIPEGKHLEHLHTFVKVFGKTQLTEEQILNLSIPDVLQGFFLCRKQLLKSVKHSIRLTKLIIKKQKAQAKA